MFQPYNGIKHDKKNIKHFFTAREERQGFDSHVLEAVEASLFRRCRRLGAFKWNSKGMLHGYGWLRMVMDGYLSKPWYPDDTLKYCSLLMNGYCMLLPHI